MHKKVLSTENFSQGWYIKPPLSQYVGWGWHKKCLFTENLKQGLYKKPLFKLDMLGRAGTKMLNSRKMLGGNGIETASLTQCVRRGWRKKSLFTENARLGWYKC